MANQSFTDLTADTSPASADIVATAKSPFGAGSNRKVTLANLLKQIFTSGGTELSIGSISDGQFLKRSGTSIVSSTETAIIQVACSDETTALTTGTAKVTFRMPKAMTVTAVRGSLTTAQGSGSIFTVDINENGVSILSTKLTIDNTELTSTTAATPPVISDSALADDAQMTVDIDQVGDGTAKGLKVSLIGVWA